MMETGVERWAVNSRSWTPSEFEFLAFLYLLPVSERSRVLRYFKFEDRKRALVSRLLQRKLVHTVLGLPYDEILIERTKEGKPYLANIIENSPFPSFNFNLAHQGDYVVLVSEPLCLVGVDVMTHEPTKEEPPAAFFKPFRNCYTPSEWDMVFRAGPNPGPMFDQFYRLWCLKEAYIKAVGIGLGFELQRAEFYHIGGNLWSDLAYVRIDGQEKPDWRFSLHKLGDNHWVSVSKGPPSEAVDSYKKTLPKLDHNPTAFASALASVEKLFTFLKVWDLIPDSEKHNFESFQP